MAASYVLSGVLLGLARARGVQVSLPALAGWWLTGIVGLALAWSLRPGRPTAWLGLLAALGPWMAYSLYGDLRLRAWVMAAVDLAGLVAIAYGLWLGRAALRG